MCCSGKKPREGCLEGLFHGEFGRNAKGCRETDEKEQLTPEKQKVTSRPCNHSVKVKSSKFGQTGPDECGFQRRVCNPRPE